MLGPGRIARTARLCDSASMNVTNARPELTALPPPALAERTGPLKVRPGVVHVWALALEGPEDCIAWCRQRLTDDERARADRFFFERHRNEYVIAHGLLRHLLARYCDTDPLELAFDSGPSGKPILRTQPAGKPPVSFNLSHSHGRALLAVSDGRDVGIDIEWIDRRTDVLALARRYFFGSERREIENAPPHATRETFFRYWVAKEAVLKAQGVGLRFPLSLFEIRFAADGRTATVASSDPSRLSPDWTVRMLTCEPGWMGAVAAAGEDWQVEIMSGAS